MSNNCFVMSLTHYSCCQTKKGFVNAAFLPFAKPSRIFNFVEAHCQVPYSQPGGGRGQYGRLVQNHQIYILVAPLKYLIKLNHSLSLATFLLKQRCENWDSRSCSFIPILSTVLSANKMFGGDWWSSG